MKLTITRAALVAGFQSVGNVVPTRTPREIFKNVKLELSPASANLIATNGDGLGIRYELDESALRRNQTEPVEILIPAGRFQAILRELTDETVGLEAESGQLEIRNGYSKFTLNLEDPKDFPALPSVEQSEFIEIAAADMRKAIKRILFATDNESTRYALGGVLMVQTDGYITFAATDSRRLAVLSVPYKGGCLFHRDPCPVVPSAALSLLDRCLDGEQPLRCIVRENDIVMQTGRATIIAQLVQGRFPDYRKVIPTKFTAELPLVCGPFLSAVRQAQLTTSDDSRGVDFEFSKEQLRLTSKASDIGQSNIAIPISYQGDGSISIRFDPKYLIDFLKVLDPGTVITAKLIDGESPGTFTTADGYTYVVMPLSKD